MAWYNDVWDFAKENALELAKMGGAGAKAYIDIKDQKRRNELEEAAYRNYMSNVEAAGKEAQAAIDLNLMPMEISNVPTSKADVSDFTAVAARGGLMNLPNRQRKRYASQGFVEDDIEIMEPESLGDFELQKEEGVNIGPMAGFPDTGDPMSNAQQVWQSGAIDQGIYQMDFNIFFQSGDWMDYISKEEVQGDMQMASAPGIPGIEGLRHGGRPGYEMGLGPVGRNINPAETETETEWISQVSPTKEVDTIHRIYEEKGSSGLNEYLERNPDLKYKYVIVTDGMGGELTVMPNQLHSDHMDMENIMLIEPSIEMFNENKAKGGIAGLKKGGRVKRDNGGIMNLGGMEKDYRTTGGFVPIGAYEKKDDVPARLSKNEFVMTADAVRAAGGGSINKGAQRMYDTMKHLEAQPQAKRMTV